MEEKNFLFFLFRRLHDWIKPNPEFSEDDFQEMLTPEMIKQRRWKNHKFKTRETECIVRDN